MSRLPRCVALLVALSLLPCAGACRGQSSAPQTPSTQVAPRGTAADTTFAARIDRLSEPGGYFDTDNLISNERSYLHVLGTLASHGVQGGAYLGVGPDQNFAYMARIRPELAIIIDIRRDNLLQHLLFKALFETSENRIVYLCRLFGLPVPSDADAWSPRTIEALIAYADATPSLPETAAEAQRIVQNHLDDLGLPLSDDDHTTITAIHQRFIRSGLSLRFNSHNRPPQSYYPTYRDLMRETDLSGRFGHYLAHEDDFRFLKAMEEADRVIPVVGDLSGTDALPAIGRFLAEQGLVVSAFYTSNIEFYLMRQGRFDRFVANLRLLPIDEQSVIIRSYFNRFSASHPQSVPGYASTQLVEPLPLLLDEADRGGYATYGALISRHILSNE